MKNSKFDKLFHMIMQSYGDTYDKTQAYGRSAYNLNQFDRSNQLMQALNNGQPVIDPADDNPVYWQVIASHYPGYDMITGQKFPKYTTVFSYKPCKVGSEKSRKYVTLNTYENATPQIQAKLNSIGLKPGFKYNLAMEDTYDKTQAYGRSAQQVNKKIIFTATAFLANPNNQNEIVVSGKTVDECMKQICKKLNISKNWYDACDVYDISKQPNMPYSDDVVCSIVDEDSAFQSCYDILIEKKVIDLQTGTTQIYNICQDEFKPFKYQS